MGILNVTPDSFYQGSRAANLPAALEIAEAMMRDGADIIDIGGESTRPGSDSVDANEQIKRIVPVIREIRALSSIDISVDTRIALVAEAALDAGATIINDISALRDDETMAKLAAEREVSVVLMHMRGKPRTMQENPYYKNVVEEVHAELRKFIEKALAAGIRSERIILDPGIGFGKRVEDNMALLRNLGRFRNDGFPLLVGLSRKSFLGALLDNARLERDGAAAASSTAVDKGLTVANAGPTTIGPDGRLPATLAAHAYCLSQGVDYLRVHDVKETVQLVTVWEALSWDS